MSQTLAEEASVAVKTRARSLRDFFSRSLEVRPAK